MRQKGGRPVAFIQVDLDGLWAVRRCYGLDGSPEQDDPVYSHSLPALLRLFDELSLRATFFAVGADARVPWKARLLQEVLARGHELGNHSMNHNLAFARLEESALEREIAECQAALKDALGVEARGFRAPGYGWSAPLIRLLERQGFSYDASLFPTSWGWLLRWIGRRISSATGGTTQQYGTRQGGQSPLRPYHPDPRHPEKPKAGSERPDAGERTTATGRETQGNATEEFFRGNSRSTVRHPGFWEIPVSVSPRLRLPFHGGVGYLLGRRWVARAIASLARREGFLNYLIHGMDLVDGRRWDVVPGRAGRWFFRGSETERLRFFADTCARIARQFEVQRTDLWVERAAATEDKPPA